MRLPDFTFPGDTLPDILSRANEFNQYIDQVSAENFIKIGVSGEGEPRVIPGILDSVEVSDALLTDDVEIAGKSGSVKIISGWADSDVTVNLLLIDIPSITNNAIIPNVTRFDCLREITWYFKRIKDGKPRVYTIQHPHLKAWGLREFLFNSLKSGESRGKRVITCTLEFDEFDSVAGKSQDRQLGAAQNAANAEEEKSVTPSVSDKTRRGLGELEAKYAKL